MATHPVVAWESARAELVPSVGERVADLIACALLGSSRSADATQLAADAAARLRAGGDDPASPAVTEVEAALIGWARTVAATAESPETADARLDGFTSTALRERLAALAAAARAL